MSKRNFVGVDTHLTENPVANDTILFGRDGLTGRRIRHHQSAPRLSGSGAYKATGNRAANKWSAARHIQSVVRRHQASKMVAAAAKQTRLAKAKKQQRDTLNRIAENTCPICLEQEAKTPCPGNVCQAKFHKSCLDCSFRMGHGVKCPACRWRPADVPIHDRLITTPRGNIMLTPPEVGRGINWEDLENISPVRFMRMIERADLPRAFTWIFNRQARSRHELVSARQWGPLTRDALASVLHYYDENGTYPRDEPIRRIEG